MFVASMRRVAPLTALSLRSSALRPPLLGARSLCEAADEARKAELLEFLRCASRPIMGKAKARQSAGQKALDLTKQAKNLDDLDLRALVRCDQPRLPERGTLHVHVMSQVQLLWQNALQGASLV